jgi:hypothetical protein
MIYKYRVYGTVLMLGNTANHCDEISPSAATILTHSGGWRRAERRN